MLSILSILSNFLIIMSLWEGVCEFSFRLLLIAHVVRWLQYSLLCRTMDAIIDHLEEEQEEQE
jgi:hypothetical protein